jgi:S1 RNA binding domain protein
MPKVGDLVQGKVLKVLDEGAIISLDANLQAFMPIGEVSEKFVKRGKIGYFVKEGQSLQFRVTKMGRFKGKERITVSLKRVDEEGFKKQNFEKKMQRFLKNSGEIQSQIRKNTERKHGTLKKKPKKND